jgi:hypothetical protein
VTDADWVRGDLLGHDLPVHVETLRTGGLWQASDPRGLIDWAIGRATMPR